MKMSKLKAPSQRSKITENKKVVAKKASKKVAKRK